MHLFAYILFLSIHLSIYTGSQAIPLYNPEITSIIFAILHEKFKVGLILIPFEEVKEDLSPIDLSQLAVLPYVVFESNEDTKLIPYFMKNCINNRYSHPYFVHTNIRLPSSWKSSRGNWSWRKMYLQLLGHQNDLINNNSLMISPTMNPFSNSAINRLMFKDVFLYVEKDNSQFLERSTSSWNAGLIPFNSVKLVFHHHSHYRHAIQNIQAVVNPIGYNPQSSSGGISTSLSIICPFCKQSDLILLNSIHNLGNATISKYYSRIRFSKILFLCYNAAIKLQNFKLHFRGISYSHILSNFRKLSETETYRSSENLLSFRKRMSQNNLIFISRKCPSSESSSSVFGPFTMVSWIGIVLAYVATAIVFGVVKALTMNNFDESLYEYVMHQLLNIINEDRIVHRKKIVISNKIANDGTVNRTSDDLLVDDIESGTLLKRTANHDVIISMDNEKNESRSITVHHGRSSKAILHGTIRLVSFVLIAMYEGKLYNSITFPKPRLLSTFEDLVASEKYSVKITTEAEQNTNFGPQFSKFLLLNDSTTLKYYDTDSSKNKLLRSRTPDNDMHSGSSVNIEDCINWVEYSPSNSNHACVGYEFELRNLQKTHRFDKLVTKSNKKLFKQGFRGYASSRRSFRIFPGAFHISKWIMESGILNLLNLAENSFSDSLGHGQLNESKVFTIRDYLGLFIVYFVLLFLSFFLFLSEYGLGWANKKFDLHNVKDYWRFSRRHAKQLFYFLSNRIKSLVWKCKKRIWDKNKVSKIYNY